MAKVVAPITALVEVIGKSRESSYEAGSFYYPTLFIDLSQPEESQNRKIWKNLSADEVSQIKKGDRVQLIPAGKDKNGKDKHNIVLLQEPPTVSDSQVHESISVAEEDAWSPEQKRVIANYVENQADLLGFCLKVSRQKFANVDNPLVETEESIRALAVSLYIATQRRFQM